VWGGKGLNLTAAAARLWGWGIPKGWAFSIAAWAGAGFQGFIHLVTDDVHQALEHLLHIDILLGAGLKELKTWMGRRRGQCRRSCESQRTGPRKWSCSNLYSELTPA
jgi:4-amino-4-deoxy-L-arabinose transferase-like glycosyltransferase